MIKVLVNRQSNYPVKSADIKKVLRKFFEKEGIVSDSEVSVAFVGKKKMIQISKQYLKDSSVHNVLSFTPDEAKDKFVFPPSGKIQLGEIIVCYPEAVDEAKKEGKRINQKLRELIEHGALHLLGIHHN